MIMSKEKSYLLKLVSGKSNFGCLFRNIMNLLLFLALVHADFEKNPECLKIHGFLRFFKDFG